MVEKKSLEGRHHITCPLGGHVMISHTLHTRLYSRERRVGKGAGASAGPVEISWCRIDDVRVMVQGLNTVDTSGVDPGVPVDSSNSP